VQFIRPRDVVEMIGVSRTTLWRMVQAGTFPPPVRITERNRGYLLEAVEEWMKSRSKGTSVPRMVPVQRARRTICAEPSPLFPDAAGAGR
jgi:prophage regulatory protein